MVVVCLIFERMLSMCSSILCTCLLYGVYYLRCFFVGIYLVINRMPMILCFISVMWNVCLNGLFKILFCSIVVLGTRKSWIFP